MSNTRGSAALSAKLFALIVETLVERRGTPEVAEKYASLLTLASLAHLDQPQLLAPTRLIHEIHGAWEELWTVQLVERSAAAATVQRNRARTCGNLWHAQLPNWLGEATLGMYLARPLHQLASFAAAGGKGTRLRAASHPRLIVDSTEHPRWRLIRGGADGG